MKAAHLFQRRSVQCASLIAICGLAAWLFHVPILVSLANWLDVGEPPRAADYIMVLPGGPEQRPFVAVAMMHAGLAKGVLTPETETAPSNDEGLVPVNDAVLRRVLELRGIREDQIVVLPGKSESTWTDALALAKFINEHPTATVAIVTHGFHTRRSKWVFDRVLKADANRVFFVSAKLDRVDPNSWWKTEDGLETYLGEFAKLLFYVGSDQVVIAAGLGIMTPFVLIYVMRRRRDSGAKPIDSGHSHAGVQSAM